MVHSALYIISHHQQNRQYSPKVPSVKVALQQQRCICPNIYIKSEKIKTITKFYKDYCLSNIY